MPRPDDPDKTLKHVIAVLAQTIARMEWQVKLLRSVIAKRSAEGRDHERLDGLAAGTEHRAALLRAERKGLIDQAVARG